MQIMRRKEKNPGRIEMRRATMRRHARHARQLEQQARQLPRAPLTHSRTHAVHLCGRRRCIPRQIGSTESDDFTRYSRRGRHSRKPEVYLDTPLFVAPTFVLPPFLLPLRLPHLLHLRRRRPPRRYTPREGESAAAVP